DPTRLGLGADPNVAANLGAAWIRGHAVLAAVEVQPLMVFMRVPDGPYDLAGRRQLARAWFDEVLSLDLDGFSVGDFAAPGQAAGNPAAWTWTPGTPPGDPGNVFADLVMQFSAELAALP
ncbi:MAG: hypothetical protein KC620_18265, partial [Myxococcales bacterium]|nr:hypothetical protein [Myxococcales bacterium]